MEICLKTHRRSSFKAASLAAAVFATYAGVPPAWSQAQISGSLRGTIVDSAGAAVPNAIVHLLNPGDGSDRPVPANGQGQFSLTNVQPGTYALRVEAPGFEAQVFSKIEFILNQVRELNVTLKPGEVSQQVEVTGDAASLTTLDTSVGSLIDEQRIQALPLNGRDFQNLIYLSAGTTRDAGGTGQGSTTASGGARPTNNNFLIDGGDSNDPRVPSGSAGNIGNSTSSVPIDAIREFTVITSSPTAQFGRSSGSVVNVVTRSGTNDQHFTLWEFARNKALNTRNFFNPIGFKSPFNENEFGGWGGGKLWRDKLFYSGAYEGFRQRSTTPTNVQVPTTQFIDALTQPLTQALFRGAYPAVSGPAFDPANPATWQGSFNRNEANNVDADTGFLRLDRNFSEKNQAFATLSIVDAVPAAALNGGNLPGDGVGQTGRDYHVVVQDTWIASPHFLNTARVSLQRTPTAYKYENSPAGLIAAGTLRSAPPNAGAPFSTNTADPNGIPTIAFLSSRFNTIGVANNFPQGRTEDVLTYQDSIGWEHGRHDVKAGFQLARVYDNTVFSNNVRPSDTVLDSVAAPAANGLSAAQASAEAEFANINALALNTQQQSFYNSGSSERGYRLWEQGYFVQDTWRATSRVTLDLGLRWEIYNPFTESKNLLSNAYVLDSSGKPESCTHLPFSAGLASVAVVNPTQYSIGSYCSKFNDFAPRVGVAWDAKGNGTTVVRAGYGIYYDRVFGNVYGNSRFNPPYTVSTTLTGGNYTGQIASSAVNPTNAYSLTTIDPGLRNPMTEQYNLAVSQQLDANTVLTLTYVGATGSRLLATQQPNLGSSFANGFRPSNGDVNARSQVDINNGIIRPPFADFTHRVSIAGSSYNALLVDARRRLASGLTVEGAYTWSHSRDDLSDDVSGSNDSSTPQATLENLLAPLMAAGSSCPGASGTPSAASRLQAAVICATGNSQLSTAQAESLFVQNYLRYAPIQYNYGDSSYDVRQRFAGSVIYALPFGHNARFFAAVPPTVDRTVSGWSISSIIDTQTGTPFIPVSGADANKDGNTNDRTVAIGNLGPSGGRLIKTFGGPNPVVSYFQNATAQSAGDGVVDPRQRLERGTLRQPGITNWDFQAVKSTKLTEQLNLRFSADFFNILNHTNFSPLSTSISNATYGQALSQRLLGQTEARQIQFGLKLEY